MGNREILLGVVLFLVGLIIRTYVLYTHNVTPDEAWHLADGLFVSQGKIPIVDFSSRQPLYVYLLGMSVKFFGSSFLVGRWLLFLASAGTFLFLYLIAELWFGKKVALLAMAIYSFFPFAIIYDPIIQEQGLVIFFNCAAIYTVSYSLFRKRTRCLLWVAGILFAGAYYSRQTGLASLMAVTLFLLVYEKFHLIAFLKKYSWIFLGFFSLVAAFFWYYSRHLPLGETVNSNVNPFFLVLKSVGHLTANVLPSPAHHQSPFNLGLQSSQITRKFFTETYQYNFFLVVAFVLLLILGGSQMITRRTRRSGEWQKSLFFTLWVGGTILFYAYHYFYRGFFPQYIREFQVPLVLAFSYLVFYFAEKLLENDRITDLIVLIFGAALTALLLYRYSFQGYPGKLVSVLLMGILLTPLIAWKLFHRNINFYVPGFSHLFHLGALVLLAGVFVFTYAHSGRFLSIHYHGLWSPHLVKEVAKWIENHSTVNDGVLAGSPIWAMEANRRIVPPYSHPLIFKEGVSEELDLEIKNWFHHDPPQIIITDRYTEEAYFSCFTWMKELFRKNYSLKKTFTKPGSETVQVYTLSAFPGGVDR